MTVLRVTVPDQYFCTKHPDLNITAREKKVGWGQVSLPMEKYSPLDTHPLFTLHTKYHLTDLLKYYLVCIVHCTNTIIHQIELIVRKRDDWMVGASG